MAGLRKPSLAMNNEYIRMRRQNGHTRRIVLNSPLCIGRKVIMNTALMSALSMISVNTNSAYAAVGDQIIVKDVTAATGWTAIVPLNLNGDNLTDMLSYNAKTGRAIYSVGANPAGTQVIVKDLIAAKGWTAIVPLKLNGDNLTDMLSYNANTGRAIYSVAAQP
jgi:hypothetical protein